MSDATRIAIREVDPDAQRESILAVLRRNLPTAAAPERLDWLYLSNPDGRARVWLAEAADGTPVGTSSAHPRRMRVGGSPVRALNLGDFAVDEAYRTLGPGLQLLRATLAPVRSGAYAFSYDYASRPMQALYTRMGCAALGTSERWVRPVSSQALVRRRVGDGMVADIVGAAADAALRTHDALKRATSTLEVDILSGMCGEAFDAVDRRTCRSDRVEGIRDAAYLNWRYLQHTMWRHTILCAGRAGALIGYAVLRHSKPESISLVNLQTLDDGERIGRALIDAAADWARFEGVESLDVEILATSDSARFATELGFIRREAQPGPVIFWAAESPHASCLAEKSRWWLMGGDRDI